MISCLNKIFVVLIFVLIFLFYFLFCSILERKDDKSFKQDIIVLISCPILLVSNSFLVNIGKVNVPFGVPYVSVVLSLLQRITPWFYKFPGPFWD